jgi:hypothetical protein
MRKATSISLPVRLTLPSPDHAFTEFPFETDNPLLLIPIRTMRQHQTSKNSTLLPISPTIEYPSTKLPHDGGGIRLLRNPLQKWHELIFSKQSVA